MVALCECGLSRIISKLGIALTSTKPTKMKKERSDEATDKSLEGASLLLKKNLEGMMMMDSGEARRKSRSLNGKSRKTGFYIRFPRKLARLRRAARDSKQSESLTQVTFRHPFLTEFYFLCKATILSSKMLAHEPTSRIRDLTSVQLRFTWVIRFNGLSNPWFTRSTGQLVLTGQRRSATGQLRSTTVQCRSMAVNVFFLFFLAPALHKKSNGYTRISRIRTTENSAG
ncbi:hypothetical protein PIB30_080421 [Stylosanthes scabra]|uniref:Uncharacterized protein n=1 Tax=Stylosanthes scabra TaxID=79078 RepID=A0ABU6XQ30_9FABA|nr:hypothetical protein [Stylosanthes scabra]